MSTYLFNNPKLSGFANMKIILEDHLGPTSMSMPPLEQSTFADATTITPTEASGMRYTAKVRRDWCIGLVPHGGYLMSIVSETVLQYFQTRHPTLNQLDLITFHVEFLSKTVVGDATVSIQPLKIGRQFSVVRVSVSQWDETKNTEIVRIEALVTQGNIAQEAQGRGINLATKGLLDRTLIPTRDKCEKFEADPRLLIHRPALFKIEIYLLEGSNSLCASPTLGPEVREQWVRWAPGVGTAFSISSLAFLADCFRPLPEAFGITNGWFPTLSYGLEVKRAPPVGGWTWLFLRIEIGLCIEGRHDYTIVVVNEKHEVVAISRHTALIFAYSGNLSPRAIKV